MKLKFFLIALFIFVVAVSFSDVVVENNMVSFYFESDTASSVSLIGNFNDWDPFATPMKGEDGEWFVQLKLKPGVYQYAFLVNGSETVEDPNEYGSIKNDLGTYNSVFVLKTSNNKLYIDAQASKDYAKSVEKSQSKKENAQNEISLPDGYEGNTPKNKELSPKIVDSKVVFSFKPEEKADSVFLAGSFNSWNSSALKMAETDGIYKASLELKDGIYQYKFVVNGSQWKEDPNSYGYLPDGYGGKNSVLIIKDAKIYVPKVGSKGSEKAVTIETKPKTEVKAGPEIVDGYVVFRFKYPSASSVNLAGTFNNWDQKALSMKLKNGYWEAKLKLEPGSYEYKFVVDGSTWIEDPKAFEYVPDPYGGKNSVITLKEENGKLTIVKPSKKAKTSLLKGNVEFKIGASLNSLWFSPESYNLITLTIAPKIPNVSFNANFNIDTAGWALNFSGMELKIENKPFLVKVYNNWHQGCIEFLNSNGYVEDNTLGIYGEAFGAYTQIGMVSKNFYYGIGYKGNIGPLSFNLGYFDNDFSRLTFGRDEKTITAEGIMDTKFGKLSSEVDFAIYKFQKLGFKFSNDSLSTKLSYDSSNTNVELSYNYSIGKILNGQIGINYIDAKPIFYLSSKYILSKENSLNLQGKYINSQIDYNLFYQYSKDSFEYSVFVNNLPVNINTVYNDSSDYRTESVNFGFETRTDF